jgi:hypothetical protein
VARVTVFSFREGLKTLFLAGAAETPGQLLLLYSLTRLFTLTGLRFRVAPPRSLKPEVAMYNTLVQFSSALPVCLRPCPLSALNLPNACRAVPSRSSTVTTLTLSPLGLTRDAHRLFSATLTLNNCPPAPPGLTRGDHRPFSDIWTIHCPISHKLVSIRGNVLLLWYRVGFTLPSSWSVGF